VSTHSPAPASLLTPGQHCSPPVLTVLPYCAELGVDNLDAVSTPSPTPSLLALRQALLTPGSKILHVLSDEAPWAWTDIDAVSPPSPTVLMRSGVRAHTPLLAPCVHCRPRDAASLLALTGFLALVLESSRPIPLSLCCSPLRPPALCRVPRGCSKSGWPAVRTRCRRGSGQRRCSTRWTRRSWACTSASTGTVEKHGSAGAFEDGKRLPTTPGRWRPEPTSPA